MNLQKRKKLFVKKLNEVKKQAVVVPVALKELPPVPVINKVVQLPAVVEEINVVVDVPATPVEVEVKAEVEQQVVETSEEVEQVAKSSASKGKKSKKDFEVGE